MWERFWNWAVDGTWKDFPAHDRVSLNFFEWTVSRNLNFEDAVRESSKGSEEDIIGKCRKGDLCYVVTESMTTLPPSDMWKMEHVPNELGFVDKEISKLPSCCL